MSASVTVGTASLGALPPVDQEAALLSGPEIPLGSVSGCTPLEGEAAVFSRVATPRPSTSEAGGEVGETGVHGSSGRAHLPAAVHAAVEIDDAMAELLSPSEELADEELPDRCRSGGQGGQGSARTCASHTRLGTACACHMRQREMQQDRLRARCRWVHSLLHACFVHSQLACMGASLHGQARRAGEVQAVS